MIQIDKKSVRNRRLESIRQWLQSQHWSVHLAQMQGSVFRAVDQCDRQHRIPTVGMAAGVD